MSKVIFLSLPYYGHTYPTTPLVAELVKRGEQVIFYSLEEFKPMIEAAGAQFRDYGSAGLTPDHKNMTLVKVFKHLMDSTLHLTGNLMEEIKQEKPDYILHDSTAHWGRIIAQSLKIPAVCIFTHFCINTTVAKKAQREEFKNLSNFFTTLFWSFLNTIPTAISFLKLNKKYGYKPKSIAELTSFPNDLNIVLVSRLLQPHNRDFDESYRFVGPSLGKRLEKVEPPLADFLNRKEKIIYIALGSVYHNNIKFYQNCIRAFEGTRFNVLISCGKEIAPEEFGELPDNFLILPAVPQLEVLKKASLFYTHGGMNSTNEGFYYGVPMVVIPQAIDQFIIANQVETLQAGVVIRKKVPTPKQLSQACEEIFSNRQYQINAEKVRQSLLEAGGPQRAAGEILEFASARTTLREAAVNA